MANNGISWEESTPLIAAKAASFGGFSYTRDSSANEASCFFLFSYDISIALLNHSSLIAYKHQVYKALETFSYLRQYVPIYLNLYKNM